MGNITDITKYHKERTSKIFFHDLTRSQCPMSFTIESPKIATNRLFGALFFLGKTEVFLYSKYVFCSGFSSVTIFGLLMDFGVFSIAFQSFYETSMVFPTFFESSFSHETSSFSHESSYLSHSFLLSRLYRFVVVVGLTMQADIR